MRSFFTPLKSFTSYRKMAGFKTLIFLTGAIISFMLLSFSSVILADDMDYQKGLKYYRSKNYKEAIIYFEKYVQIQPDPSTFYMLGYAFYKLGDFEKSRKYFDKVYLINPDFTVRMIPENVGLSIEEQKIVNDLLELSGAKQQIAQMMDVSYNTAFELQLSKIQDDKIRQDVEIIIKDTLNFNKIYSPIVKEFQEYFNKRHAVSAISWLKSPLGEKMTKAELNQSGADETGVITEFKSISDKRKKLFEKFVQTINSNGWVLKIISVSMHELADGLQPYLNTKERERNEQFKAYINNAINKMSKEQITFSLMTYYAYIYRGLSDEELEAALRFYESPSGRWLNNSFYESIIAGIGIVSRECGKKLGMYLEDLNKSKQNV